MLDLSRVTLVFVETRAHEITKRVIDDMLTKVKFGSILIYTDKPDLIPVEGARYLNVIDFVNKKQAGLFYYGRAMLEVETDFALLMEWDAGIFDATKWKPEFFDYDYIGAPWVMRPEFHGVCDVGNGGFALMSKKLGHYICRNVRTWPVYTDMDVSKLWRPKYEAAGFKWPLRDLAAKFSWELGPRDPEHFGYHGSFTWPSLLPLAEVVARAKLMLKTGYLRQKIGPLFRACPDIVNHFDPEELQVFCAAVPPSHVLRPRIPGMMSPQQRAAMLLMQAHHRGLITPNQKSRQAEVIAAQTTGQKA